MRDRSVHGIAIGALIARGTRDDPTTEPDRAFSEEPFSEMAEDPESIGAPDGIKVRTFM